MKNVLKEAIIKPDTISASKAERSEYKLVRDVFSSGKCVRESIYKTFQIENPTGRLQQQSLKTNNNMQVCQLLTNFLQSPMKTWQPYMAVPGAPAVPSASLSVGALGKRQRKKPFS